MDITPDINLLRSLRGENLNYLTLIGEGVDNAFDAGAEWVSVDVKDLEIVFQDNGDGIRYANIQSLFSLGSHGAMPTTQLGRFGIGIKSQAVNAGNIFKVRSTSEDGLITAGVNWAEMLSEGKWRIKDPIRMASVGPTGTTITISGLRETPKINDEKVRADLALRFYPGIRDGREIRLNSIPVELLAEPAMTDIIDVSLPLSEGRAAHLRAGILTEPSKLNKVHVSYKHRVLKPAQSFGCDEYTGLTKMFARVQISGTWHLAKYKDDLTDGSEKEELEEAVEEALLPILKKVNASSMSAKVNHICNLINDQLPPALSASRPHRKEKDRPKKTAATDSRRKPRGTVDPDKADPGGPALSRRSPQDRLKVTLEGDAEKDGIGGFERGSRSRPHRVNLAKTNPFIADVFAHRDERFGARCLAAIALILYEEGISNTELALDPSFGLRVAKHLALPGNAKLEAA